jgi:3-oxoacyl-[acyl-carrier protein] reductase
MDLSGKTALVTGAGRGIGRAIALRLAADGAHVILNYGRSADAARRTVDEIETGGGRAVALEADLADLGAIDLMFERIRKLFPALDILVNNAGRGTGMRTLEESTRADFELLMAINARGPFFVTQHAVRMMGDGGRIVNVSSTSTRVRISGMSMYAGTKAALEAYTRIWAAELAGRQITVNAVLPGIVDTDLVRDNLTPEMAEWAAKRVPMGRMGQPRDIADVVAFLCSDGARWVTGQEILVSGGS